MAAETTASEVDVVIGIVGNYIEKAEVIEEAVKAGKKVILFFSKYQDPKNTIPAEGREVEAFRREMDLNCNCYSFGNKVELENVLTRIIKSL